MLMLEYLSYAWCV